MSANRRIQLSSLFLIGIIAAHLASCGTGSDRSATSSATDFEPTRTQIALAEPTRAPTAGTAQLGETMQNGYTHHRADGNRLVAGRGPFPDSSGIDLPLGGTPVWVVGVATETGSLWVVVLADGQVQAYHAVGGKAEPISITPRSMNPESPPLLQVQGGIPTLFIPPLDLASQLTHALPLQPERPDFAWLDLAGDLVLRVAGDVHSFPLNAPMDSRLLQDERGRVLLLTDATERYGHGVLGDGVEAGGFALIGTAAAPELITQVALDPPAVIEGIAPLWADLDGDGQREIAVTVSDEFRGARVEVFSEGGERLASGPAIGRGFRWRHQVAVAPMGPDGEIELVAIRTPHIGGVAEFYRLSSERLEIVAELAGYSSHRIGSRNLDAGLVGDFDGDGRLELLVPDQGQTRLAGIRREGAGAAEVWSQPLGSRLSTNLAAVTLADGSIAVGAGTELGTLWLWLP